MAAVPLLIVLCGYAGPSPDTIEREILPEGEEYWYHSNSPTKTPYLFRLLAENCHIPIPGAAPFGKSAALLVGTSTYQYLSPQLPSVTNDLALIRKLLLSKGGFDEVYVLADNVVTRERVEKYVKSILPASVGPDGRILFYYSGHGSDEHGKTGYMQFSQAKEGEFYGRYVLPMNEVRDWSKEVEVRHMLFVLDCCSAGMALFQKATLDDKEDVARTLSGNGSRTFLSAGTADEKTYALDARKSVGYGILTRAFADAFGPPGYHQPESGFVTIGEVFTTIEKQVARFNFEYRKSIHPNLDPVKDPAHNGTFVFVNPNALGARLSVEEASLLKVPLDAKGLEPTSLAEGLGTFQLTSYLDGDVFIDSEPNGVIRAGQMRTYFHMPAGQHRIEVRGTNSLVSTFQIASGELTLVSLSPGADQVVQSPRRPAPGEPSGSLRIKVDISGDLYVDTYKIGPYEAGKLFLVENLSPGIHAYTVRGTKEWVEDTATVEVDKTTVARPTPPSPPTNLRIISVQ